MWYVGSKVSQGSENRLLKGEQLNSSECISRNAVFRSSRESIRCQRLTADDEYDRYKQVCLYKLSIVVCIQVWVKSKKRRTSATGLEIRRQQLAICVQLRSIEDNEYRRVFFGGWFDRTKNRKLVERVWLVLSIKSNNKMGRN